jgi:hypothetical protein
MAVPLLKQIIETASNWPPEDQAELAEYARVIEARRTGRYRVSDEERSAIAEGLAQADQADYASDEAVAELARRFHG